MNHWFPYNECIPSNKHCLICFPHSGAGASIYQKWKSLLPDHIEIMAVQLPGRETRFDEPLHNEISNVVEELLDVVELIRSKNQIALFGHSLGASIAFECARQLKDSEIKTFVSASNAPNIEKEKKIHTLSDQQFLCELSRYGGLSKSLLEEKELLDLFLPLLRADIAMSENYICDDSCKIPGDLIVISGKTDSVVTENKLNGWKALTEGKFDHIKVPGDHFYHQNSPRLLLEIIKKHLN